MNAKHTMRFGRAAPRNSEVSRPPPAGPASLVVRALRRTAPALGWLTAAFTLPATAATPSAPLPVTPIVVTPAPALPSQTTGEATTARLVPHSLKEALTGQGMTYEASDRYINGLGDHLPAAEITLLLAYPASAPRPGTKFSKTQFHALKNDTINALRRQSPPPAELTAALTALFDNPKADAVMRDYALQHLALWRPVAARSYPAQTKEIDEELWLAVGEPGQSWAGTALLALLGETEDGVKGVDRARLGATALALAGSATAPEAVRVTALSACGRLGLPGVLDLAHRLADRDPSTIMQVAALAVLGQGHRAEDRELLEATARTAPPLAAAAATRALEVFKSAPSLLP